MGLFFSKCPLPIPGPFSQGYQYRILGSLLLLMRFQEQGQCVPIYFASEEASQMSLPCSVAILVWASFALLFLIHTLGVHISLLWFWSVADALDACVIILNYWVSLP